MILTLINCYCYYSYYYVGLTIYYVVYYDVLQYVLQYVFICTIMYSYYSPHHHNVSHSAPLAVQRAIALDAQLATRFLYLAISWLQVVQTPWQVA